MATRRRRYAKPAASAGGTLPSGILRHVLLDYWMSLNPTYRDSFPPEECARAGEGSYANAGMGCDMVSEKRNGAAGVLRSRCGEKPCRWFWYRLRVGGVVFGIRACSDHLGVALDEAGWERWDGMADDFVAWEVMST